MRNLKGLIAGIVLLSVLSVGAIGETYFVPSTGLAVAKQKSASQQCYQNLQQIALAVHVFKNERAKFPDSLRAVTHLEILSPDRLACPAFYREQAVTNWSQLNWEKLDYIYTPPPSPLGGNAVILQCRLHSHLVHEDFSMTPANPNSYKPGFPVIVADPIGVWSTPGTNFQLEARLAPGTTEPFSFLWQRVRYEGQGTNVVFVSTNPDQPEAGYWKTNRTPVWTIQPLPNETNAVLHFQNVQTNQSDYYRLVISNSLAVMASDNTRVIIDPTISTNGPALRSVVCLNNLKMIGLFGRLYGTDHQDHFPRSFAEMTNSYGLPVFGWPLALYCPDDPQTLPNEWPQVDFSKVSYEILPRGEDGEDWGVPFVRCKIHGYYVNLDGTAYRPRNGFSIHGTSTGNIILTWDPGYQLQTATNIAGPFHDNETATRPLVIQGNTATEFFHLRKIDP